MTQKAKPFEQSSQDKHTPGEWKVTTFEEYPNKRKGYMVYAQGNAGDIAKLFVAGEYSKDNPKDEEAEANARLIAKAPALLAERDRLREALRQLKKDINTALLYKRINKKTAEDMDATIQAAIAHAEGKES